MQRLFNIRIISLVMPALLAAVLLVAPAAPAAEGRSPAPGAQAPAAAKAARTAVLAWKINSSEDLAYLKAALRDMFASRIASASGVEMIREDAVLAALRPYKGAELSDAAALEAGRKLGADYALYGSLTVIGKAVSLDASLLDVKKNSIKSFHATGTGLDSVISSVDKLAAEVAGTIAPRPQAATAPVAGATAVSGTASGATATARSAAPVPAVPPVEKTLQPKGKEPDAFVVKAKEPAAPPFWKSEAIPGGYLALDYADLDGDGARELLLLGPESLLVARIRDGKLERIKEIRNAPGLANIQLAVIDLDANGADEVYVSAMRADKVETSVVEYAGGAYKSSQAGAALMLRALRTPGGNVLLGQAFRPGDGFFGPLKEFKREGGRLTDKGAYPMRLPSGADLYRFVPLYSDGAGPMGLAVIDPRNRLRLYRPDGSGGWTESYSSDEQYGGTLNLIEAETGQAGSSSEGPWRIEGRYFHGDLDGDGRPELTVKRVTPGGLGRYASVPRSYTDGRIEALALEDGGAPAQKWKTRDVKGYIADFFITDLDGDGTREIVMLVVEGSLFSETKSYILFSRLSI